MTTARRRFGYLRSGVGVWEDAGRASLGPGRARCPSLDGLSRRGLSLGAIVARIILTELGLMESEPARDIRAAFLC
jgi:hypothetical protein